MRVDESDRLPGAPLSTLTSHPASSSEPRREPSALIAVQRSMPTQFCRTSALFPSAQGKPFTRVGPPRATP